MRKSSLNVVAAVMFLIAGSAQAEQKSIFVAEHQARTFTRLWLETCMGNVGASDNLRKLLNSDKRFAKNPSYAGAILGTNEGEVWDASSGANILQAVTVYSSKKTVGERCQAQIKDVNTKSVLEKFEQAIPKIMAAGTDIVRTANIRKIGGVEYQHVSLRLHRKGSTLDPIFSMSVSDSPSAPWQAIMVQGADAAYKP